MAISKSLIGQHKRMAMGEKDVGFKKGGSVKGCAEGGSVAETFNGGSGVKREDVSGKRVKGKDGDVSVYKKGGSTKKGGKK